jgi:hypothetical protein
MALPGSLTQRGLRIAYNARWAYDDGLHCGPTVAVGLQVGFDRVEIANATAPSRNASD